MAKKIKDELLDHEYDGIKEYDNDLPPWWLWLFYICIGFGVVYMVYYHMGFGPTQAQEYEQEMQAAALQRQALEANAGAVELAFLTDAASLEAGKAIYVANCAACHAADGGGTVGPNFTDKYWLHGNKVADIVKIISKGVPEKGMIPWEKTLNPTQILQVASFVKSLEGTTPANAKEPQGDLIED